MKIAFANLKRVWLFTALAAAAVSGAVEASTVDGQLRKLLAERGVVALDHSEYPTTSPAMVRLGRNLFFDRILSGNYLASCATCHRVNRATGHEDSLAVDWSGANLVSHLIAPTTANFVPRHTPDIFNRAYPSFTRLFADGRLEVDASSPSGIKAPINEELPAGLDSLLAAQALLPLLVPDEMLGHPGENELADLESPNAIWSKLLDRVVAVPKYRQLLAEAYPDVTPPQVWSIAHIANAIAAYETYYFRADNSPFDRYLAGDDKALSAKEKAGAMLFYGRAQCSTCHAGALQTDNEFHAVAMPQIGPGKGDGPSGREDLGRARVTERSEDNYRFRTPSLRNVAITSPYGHTGAYYELRDVVKHMLAPIPSLAAYKADIVLPVLQTPKDFSAIHHDADARERIAAANELPAVAWTEADVDDLVAFLGSLTDKSFDQRRGAVAVMVPSGKREFIALAPNPQALLRRLGVK